MRNRYWLFVIAAALLLVAGCVSSRAPTTEITVTSEDLDNFVPVNTGSVDFYTAEFHIENPSNRTFRDIEVDVTLNPVTSFCHAQSTTFTLPSLVPREKKTVQFAFSEFSDLNCAYNFTSYVSSAQDG